MDNELTYGCDGCGNRFLWDTEIIWLTPCYGACSACYDKLSEAEKEKIEIEFG